MLGLVLLWLAVFRPFGHRDRTHSITIKGFQFQPTVDTLQVGDSISWSNQDIVPHTVTAELRGFDSGTIPARASWHLVARKPGRVTYHCTLHPTMKGILVIR